MKETNRKPITKATLADRVITLLLYPEYANHKIPPSLPYPRNTNTILSRNATLFNHCYNYLLTFLLSRVIYLHNFIGHVLDSVNSVMSLVDYRLYDVMVRVGFQRKDEGCLGCTSGPPSKLGSITSFGKEMYTLPNNRGTMEAKRQQRWHRQYCAAADTDTMIQLYSIQHARLGATYWTIKIKLEATS